MNFQLNYGKGAQVSLELFGPRSGPNSKMGFLPSGIPRKASRILDNTSIGRHIDIIDNYKYFVNDEMKVFYLENSPNS